MDVESESFISIDLGNVIERGEHVSLGAIVVYHFLSSWIDWVRNVVGTPCEVAVLSTMVVAEVFCVDSWKQVYVVECFWHSPYAHIVGLPLSVRQQQP